MADSQPFANAGLDMFGAQRSFINSAMQTKFENPAVGIALGGLLKSLTDNDSLQNVAQRLIEAGAVKPQTAPPAGPQAVVAPVPPAPPRAPVAAAPAAVAEEVPSAISYLPKPYTQPR